MMQQRSRAAFLALFTSILVAGQGMGAAQTPHVLVGRVSNALTGNPIGDVTVVIDSASHESATIQTDITGHFASPELPDGGPYYMTFSHRHYRNAYLEEVYASVMDINVALEPRDISTPARPLANAGPQRIFIDWQPNPETALKGYNLYRTETDVVGTPLGDPVKLNGLPDRFLGDLIEVAAYIDDDTEPGAYYIYRVQAVSGADRLSELSASSEPVKSNHLTLFIPPVYRPQEGGIVYYHPDSGASLVHIPLAVECIYDVVAEQMRLVVDLPADAFLHDADNEILVRPTAITRHIESVYQVISVDDIIQVVIEAEGAVPLYGSGVLFHIFAVPTLDEGACAPLQINAEETVVYSLSEAGELTRAALAPISDYFCHEDGCMLGDVTNNGRVDAGDAAGLLGYLVGKYAPLPGHPCFLEACDVNLDGRIDVADALLILRAATRQSLDAKSSLWVALDMNDEIYGLKNVAAAEPDVTVSLETMVDDEGVVTTILLEGAPELGGFSISVGYPADYLTLETANEGNGISAMNFLFNYEGHIYGEAQDNGLVKISATGQTSVACTSKTEIATLRFFLDVPAWQQDVLPVSVIDFSYNDSAGHTPRHTDPLAAKGYNQSLGMAAALFSTIMDSDTNKPVMNATVSISPQDHLPVSNNVNGVYTMPALPGGAYTVRATAAGYDDDVISLYIGRGETVSRSFSLQQIPVPEGENIGEGEDAREGEEQDEGEGSGEGESGEGEGQGEGEDEEKTKAFSFLSCGPATRNPVSNLGDLAVLAALAMLLAAYPKRGTCR